jgi:hypothetical protein
MALRLLSLTKNPVDRDTSSISAPQDFDCRGYSDDQGKFQLDIIVSPGDGAAPLGEPQRVSLFDLPGASALADPTRTQTERVDPSSVGTRRVRVDACLHAVGGRPGFDPSDPRWNSFGVVRVVP